MNVVHSSRVRAFGLALLGLGAAVAAPSAARAEAPDLKALFPGEITDAAACRAAHGRWNKRGSAEGCGDQHGNTGIWRVWSDDGKTLEAATTWRENVLDGPAAFFRPDGSVERRGAFKAGKREGTWRGTYDSGAPRMEESFTDDQLDGPSKRWFASGQLQVEATYVKGALDGHYTEWHASCFKRSEGDYALGKRVGVWTTWYKNGNVESAGRYEADKQVGTWRFAHEEGALLEEGEYVDGVRQGVWHEWFASGVKFRDVTYVDGVREGDGPAKCAAMKGEWTVDFEGRTEGCLLGSESGFPVRMGVWTGYFPDGKRSWDKTFENDVEEGIAHDWHPTGEILREGRYAHGVPDGKHTYVAADGKTVYGTSTITKGTGRWRSFYPDGSPREDGDYDQGAQDGPWTTWFDNGNRDTEQEYSHGLRDGVVRSWFESGEPKVEGRYAMDNREGHWIAYYTNGRKAWEGDYLAGERVGQWKNYYWEGELKAEGPHVADDEEGHWVEYYDNGQKLAEGEYVKGKKEGTWKTWWRSGEYWRDVEYKDGVEVGTGRSDCDAMRGEWLTESDERFAGCRVCRWDAGEAKAADGAPTQEEPTSSGGDDANGTAATPPTAPTEKTPTDVAVERKGDVRFEQEAHWTFWHDNGQKEKEGTFRDGEASGRWTFWYPDGQVMFDGGFEDGQEQGPWSGYYPDGAKRFGGEYEKGKPAGAWQTWGPTGKPHSAGEYDAKGEKTGRWTYFYDDGTKKDEGEFAADEEVGTWTSYWPNGQKKGEGAFDKGVRQGVWTWWRETGEVWRAVRYVDGRRRRWKRRRRRRRPGRRPSASGERGDLSAWWRDRHRFYHGARRHGGTEDSVISGASVSVSSSVQSGAVEGGGEGRSPDITSLRPEHSARSSHRPLRASVPPWFPFRNNHLPPEPARALSALPPYSVVSLQEQPLAPRAREGALRPPSVLRGFPSGTTT
ncbi:MAG: toxin-antitoxin system YwqK family antitoxin [Deltaproteobacteria bacterium]|nr:toxin-antitoxin system YwqK family antitoxin [Deltaproteobacteria bacterium]